MGVLLLIGNEPLFLSVLILRSIIRLYFYLSVLISRAVPIRGIPVESYKSVNIIGGISTRLGVLSCLNLIGGLPLFLICGGIL